MTLRGLLLEPLDVLFFRDGRPFTPASRGSSGLPMPQTLAGGLRTAILELLGIPPQSLRPAATFADAVRSSLSPEHHWLGDVRIRGPWFCRPNTIAAPLVYIPVPAVVHRHKGSNGALVRLAPLAEKLPGWVPPQPGMLPLWHRQSGATEAEDGYLTPAGLGAFLANRELAAEQIVARETLYDFDHRTGVGINADRQAAEDTLLYGASFLALSKGIALYAEIELPEERETVLDGLKLAALGGEGRRVRLKPVPRFPWPDAPASERSLVLLTTPGLFSERWRPKSLPDVLAAAVSGAVAVSGWDLARGGPKPARFAAPAGSVYFLQGGLTDWPASLSDGEEDSIQGWGCYLRGVWNDA